MADCTIRLASPQTHSTDSFGLAAQIERVFTNIMRQEVPGAQPGPTKPSFRQRASRFSLWPGTDPATRASVCERVRFVSDVCGAKASHWRGDLRLLVSRVSARP
jgi:hypothetical protein